MRSLRITTLAVLATACSAIASLAPATAHADAAPPVVTVGSPTDGSAVTDKVTVTFEVVSDGASGVDVQTGWVLADGRISTPGSVTCATPSDCTMTTIVRTVGKPNGDVTWIVEGQDTAGNTSATDLHVTINNPIPSIAFTSPDPTSGPIYGFTSLAVDVAEPDNDIGATLVGVKWYGADGKLMGEADGAENYGWPVPNLTPDYVAHDTFKAVAYDTIGDTATATLPLLVDAPPTATLSYPLTSSPAIPADGTALVSALVSATREGSVPLGHADNHVVRMDTLVDNVLRNTWTPTPTIDPSNCPSGGCGSDYARVHDIAVPLALTTLDAGWHSVTFRVTDTHQATDDYVYNMYVDPGPRVTIRRPLPDVLVGSGRAVHISTHLSSRSVTTLVGSAVKIDGSSRFDGYPPNTCDGTCTSLDQHATWFVPANARLGRHRISVLAISSSGKTTSRSVVVRVKRSTTLSLQATWTNVLRGRATTLRTQLRKLGLGPLAHRRVTLQRRRPGTTTWHDMDTKVTSSRGWVAWRLFPWATKDYRVVFTGADPLLPSHSRSVRVGVAAG